MKCSEHPVYVMCSPTCCSGKASSCHKQSASLTAGFNAETSELEVKGLPMKCASEYTAEYFSQSICKQSDEIHKTEAAVLPF